MFNMGPEHLKFLDKEYPIVRETLNIVNEHMAAAAEINKTLQSEIQRAEDKAKKSMEELYAMTEEGLNTGHRKQAHADWTARIWKENDERNKKEG